MHILKQDSLLQKMSIKWNKEQNIVKTGEGKMAKFGLSEWKKKEVINCCDCKKLGYIEDLIIDECKGCIEALVVPEGGKWCNFFGDGTEYIIPFSCIKRIGPDLILVEIHEEK